MIDSINRARTVPQVWMHDYAINNQENRVIVNDSGIYSAGESYNSLNSVNIDENESIDQSFEPSAVTTDDEDCNQFGTECNVDVDSASPLHSGTITQCDSDIDSAKEQHTTFRESLVNWAVKHQIKHTATNELLALLREEVPFIDLPNDARTLVKTPRSTKITHLQGDNGKDGQYWHYGLKRVLSEALSRVDYGLATLHLNINIDGLPMFRSSSNSFWPI